MAITQEASGSHTISAVGSEETPSGATVTTLKTFVAKVDCNALVAGEYLEIKVKSKTRSGDTERIVDSRIVSWLEASIKPVIVMEPVPSGGGSFTMTLKQIGGSARSFPWSYDTPG
jgi:hypothetical protein